MRIYQSRFMSHMGHGRCKEGTSARKALIPSQALEALIIGDTFMRRQRRQGYAAAATNDEEAAVIAAASATMAHPTAAEIRRLPLHEPRAPCDRCAGDARRRAPARGRSAPG